MDELNHVNNVIYLQWVQEISKHHWLSLAKTPFTDQYYWVVVEHELVYKKQAFLGDEITITTFVESFEGPFSIRCVEFKRADEILVRATSKWCLIDKLSNRPKRVPEEIVNLFIS